MKRRTVYYVCDANCTRVSEPYTNALEAHYALDDYKRKFGRDAGYHVEIVTTEKQQKSK